MEELQGSSMHENVHFMCPSNKDMINIGVALMKDVLLIADLHGQFGKIDSFLELNPEAVFIAGDITNMGPVDVVDDVLSRIDVPCFAVPGNCDPREILETLEHSDSVCLHGSRINLGKMSIVGIGGSNPTPFNTPFEIPISRSMTFSTVKSARWRKLFIISSSPTPRHLKHWTRLTVIMWVVQAYDAT